AMAAQTFGTVLHAVCERFLLADDLGRDPSTGQPVDLYPPGWTKCYNRWTNQPEGEVTPDEAATIQALVAKASEQGVLQRKPGRAVELEFHRQVCVVEVDDEHHEARITGFIDLAYPD